MDQVDYAERMQLLEFVRGCTFDDFLLIPQCGVLPRRDPDSVDLSARFSRRLTLRRPIVSANMDTVTRAAMAIVLAEEGGLGIIDRGFRVKELHRLICTSATYRQASAARAECLAADADNEWTDAAAVDAHAYAGWTYDYLYKRFNPTQFNADQWVSMAKAAGMKYIVLTTKHHEGFCLWDSALTDYKSPNTPAGRDLLRPFVEAFRAAGLKIGFYHSVIDWHHDQYDRCRRSVLHPQSHHDLPDDFRASQRR